VTRRWLLERMFAASAAVALPRAVLGTLTVRKGAPASSGYGTVRLWQWVTLPDSGLQVHCTSARPGAPETVAVTWTTGGTVTATFPQGALSASAGTVAIGPGTGLAVRRI
jgi:hypothetical protein